MNKRLLLIGWYNVYWTVKEPQALYEVTAKCFSRLDVWTDVRCGALRWWGQVYHVQRAFLFGLIIIIIKKKFRFRLLLEFKWVEILLKRLCWYLLRLLGCGSSHLLLCKIWCYMLSHSHISNALPKVFFSFSLEREWGQGKIKTSCHWNARVFQPRVIVLCKLARIREMRDGARWYQAET